jgi:uncharacterized protein
MLKTLGLGLLAVLGLLLVWGLLEPYVLDWQEERAEIAGLPEDWNGRQVAVIADLQVGMWLDNTWTIRRAVAGLVERRPDLVLIAGDFVYHPGSDPAPEISEVVALLRPLTEAGIPTYAVLGNHDYRMPTKQDARDDALASAVRAALEDAGIRVLHNEAVALEPSQGAPLYLVGVGAHIPGDDRVEAALAQVPDGAARIALMHHPDSFAAFPAGAAPLAVAGHTHGGQFRIPFTPDWTWMSYARDDEVHADGWVQDYGAEGNRLYINRGIGFSVVPLRLNCPPEVTVFTLNRS